jgi:hypothetical protein
MRRPVEPGSGILVGISIPGIPWDCGGLRRI